MIVLVQANILTVGLDERNEVLQELPIRLLALQNGTQAAALLKNEKVDSVISKWSLPDAEDGLFIKKFKAVKPNIPTIVFVEPDNPEQEIKARSMGVSAVLTEDASDELFAKTIANVLGIKGTVSIRQISSASKRKRKAKTLRNFAGD
jgi:DNA-binding NarL/FixJ family response regulator